MVAHTYNPRTWVVQPEDKEFKVITSCVAGSRSFWPNGDQVSENKTLRLGKGAMLPWDLGYDFKQTKNLPLPQLKGRKLET